MRDSSHFKVGIHFTFLPSYSLLSHWDLNTFHEAALSSINWNQGKSMLRVYIYQDISKLWNFIVHKKQESYKFKSKHQFVEINSTCYNIWNSYCSFKGFLSSLVHWFNLDRLIAFDMEWVPCFYVSYFLFSRNHSYRYIDPRYSIWGFGKNQEFELIFSVIDFYSLLLVDLQIPNSWN